MSVQNAEIAAMFDQAAELLEIGGENQFRVRAYRRAAREIEGLPKAVSSLLKSGADLSELPGIGKDLAGKIVDIVKTGHFGLLDALKKQLPGELGEMATLPGLGPKRIKLLYDKLRVRTLNDLRQAIKAGRLHELRGFGPAIEKKLLGALEKPLSTKRFKLSVAEAEAEALVHFLRDSGRVVVAGSYRRRRDTVGDLDVLVTARNGAAVGDRLVEYENVTQVVAHGPTRTTVMLRSGLQVDVRAVPEESYGAALLYFTGSKAHNIALRGLANQHGWKLNEYGLFSGKRRIAGATEEDVYDKLGLAYISPELREDRGEIAASAAGKLPKLVRLSDVRGDLHVHSNWTDGTVPIAEMARAAQALGYEYIALTDHSRRVAMAHGLYPARLARQRSLRHRHGSRDLGRAQKRLLPRDQRGAGSSGFERSSCSRREARRGKARGIDGCPFDRCIPVHAVRNRSGAARLAYSERRAQYPATGQIAQAVEAVNLVGG
jgi:DNA polymerase (family 10)